MHGSGVGLREEGKGVDGSGPDHPEVAVVESCQFRLTKPLSDREDRRVYEAEVGITILATDFADAYVVGRQQRLHRIRAC